MVRNWQPRLGQLTSIAIALGIINNTPPSKLLAQITPDETLGTESSVVNSDVIKGLPSDRISGGAIRGSNLFHSFQEFNISEGRGAYFANPKAIENIFSRVTGSNPSNLLGTLGVLGNANLFFLNPNGLIFGPNARLDVKGSFVGSTASSIVFPNGTQFGATNPEAPPLLTVNVQQPIGLQFEGQEGLITNAADLVVGQDLTLTGGNLDLQGQLQAGRDITLQATDTVKVRDSLGQPFIASASGKLLLQGNQGIDIFALNHADSGFFSGGDMVLRSANTIGGDAHFWANGSFRLEQLDGSLGNWLSFYDPIIRARGDVKFNSYQGASLHILAGGSVEIPGTITITQPDTTANSIQEQVTLSDSVTVLNIDGNTQPTLDIRAGIDFNTQGIANTEGFSPVPEFESNGTSANIAVSNIVNRGGVVFLTNQYQPNSNLSGGITVGLIDTRDRTRGGQILMDSRDKIAVNGTVSASGQNPVTLDFSGNGGDVTLLANGNVILNPNSRIFSNGLLGGNIALQSNGEISIISSSIINRSITTVPGTTGGELNIVSESLFVTDGALLATPTFGEANAGDINIETERLHITDGASVSTMTLGPGKAGDINITAQSVQLIGTKSSLSALAGSRGTPASGDGGNITIDTERLLMSDWAFISTSPFGSGKAGDITITAQSVELIGSILNSGPLEELSTTEASGDGGDINIDTEHLLVREGAVVLATTFGSGKAGALTIKAQSVELTGISDDGEIPSALSTQVDRGASGDGGELNIDTGFLRIADGAVISADTLGSGKAGNLTVKAQLVKVIGTSALSPSTLSTQVDRDASGDGGNLTVETQSLHVTKGAIVSAATLGSGKAGELTIKANILELDKGGQLINLTTSNFDAGNINLKVEDSMILTGTNSGIFANTEEGSSGKGGSIFIDPQTVIIRDGAKLNVDSLGTGKGGNILLKTGSATLDNGSISAETASNTGGNIELQVRDLLLLRNGSNISTSAGTAQAGGDGGNIIIDTDFIVAFPLENSDITANAFTGDGGRVEITAQGIFGIEPRVQLTPLSDITASSTSGIAGIVEINTPDLDPNRGLNNLPEEAIEVKIASGCQVEDGQTTVGFFNLGRGGLPPSPHDPLRSETIITPWIPLISQEEKNQEQALSEKYPIENTVRLRITPCRKK